MEKQKEERGFIMEPKTVMTVPLYLDRRGYLRAVDRNYRGVLVHRACWEAHYPLHGSFHVHHINGNKTDNDMSNLAAMAPKIHRRLHRIGPLR